MPNKKKKFCKFHKHWARLNSINLNIGISKINHILILKTIIELKYNQIFDFIQTFNIKTKDEVFIHIINLIKLLAKQSRVVKAAEYYYNDNDVKKLMEKYHLC